MYSGVLAVAADLAHSTLSTLTEHSVVVSIDQSEEHTAEPGSTHSSKQYVLHQTPVFPVVLFILRRFHFPLLNSPTRWFIMTPLTKRPFLLFFSKTCLTVLSPSISLQGLCTVTAAFLHFFFLASFCWVLTEAWQSYLAVIGKMRSRLIRKRFLCLGWGESSFHDGKLQ